MTKLELGFSRKGLVTRDNTWYFQWGAKEECHKWDDPSRQCPTKKDKQYI